MCGVWFYLASHTEPVAQLIQALGENDRPYKFVGEALTREKIISEKHAKLFHELRQLRNKVSHAPNFEVNSVLAKQYIEVCFALIDELSDSNNPQLKYAQH